MEDKRENNLLFNQNYNLPEDRDGFIDESTGQITEKKDLRPIDVIKKVAAETGQIVNDPKENCKKCYGRGFTARDAKTKAPIPCQCIFPPKTKEEKEKDDTIANRFARMPRKNRRKMHRDMLNKMKRDNKRKLVKGEVSDE